MLDRQQKINSLLQLVKGDISIDDLKPKDCIMMIGYGPENMYLINGKRSDLQAWNKATASATGLDIIYGDHDQERDDA